MDQSSNPMKERRCILLWILAWLYAECHNDYCDISLHIFHQGVKSSWCLELLRYFSEPLLISAWEHCAVIALGLIEYCMLLDCAFPLIQGIPTAFLKTRIGKGEEDVRKILKGICNEPLQTNRSVSVVFCINCLMSYFEAIL